MRQDGRPEGRDSRVPSGTTPVYCRIGDASQLINQTITITITITITMLTAEGKTSRYQTHRGDFPRK
ncbi:hypothetical protein [Erwinia typographi]|uniref:hypothetical protein n=1 Tax=Erwinia typographi TaxID=371042 RepID=UPI0012ED30B3|nr:hypothetical protein [Erwinia typographi]